MFFSPLCLRHGSTVRYEVDVTRAAADVELAPEDAVTGHPFPTSATRRGVIMPKTKPRKYTFGIFSILTHRGTETVTKEIDGIPFVGQKPLPDIWCVTTPNDGPMYFLADGSPVNDPSLSTEFAHAEVSTRAPKV